MIDWEAFKRQLQAQPNKMLGFVLAIAACFLLIWLLVVMQTDTTTELVTIDQKGRLDSLRLSLNQEASTDTFLVANQQNISASDAGKNKSLFTNALPTFIILLAAIGGLWYWIKRKGSGTDVSAASGSSLFATVGTQQVTEEQRISVIRINNEFWVLDTGGQNIGLLHRFSESEWNGPDVTEQKTRKTNSPFASILKKTEADETPGNNGTN